MCLHLWIIAHHLLYFLDGKGRRWTGLHDGINEVFCLLFQGLDLFVQVVDVSGEVICQISSTSWFILKVLVVVLYSELVFQDS